ncbi:hypothetical protein CPB83DRAFT_853836 [Crepidotus variabilis]|uniref:Uncharacterized protein n=1 Tax=Crepidotus variabilis TaxID=179855 RepID=A0A9P6EGW8_9AGAR|nr:hypothetical protein CPB83DRAFT_853836 [Crepidotus variabilis]
MPLAVATTPHKWCESHTWIISGRQQGMLKEMHFLPGVSIRAAVCMATENPIPATRYTSTSQTFSS